MESYKFVGPTFTDIQSWVAMEYLADTPSGDPMHHAFEGIGAVWNPATGFWEYNSIKDLSNYDMNCIYSMPLLTRGVEVRQSNARAYQGCTCRTNKLITWDKVYSDVRFGECYSLCYYSSFETFDLRYGDISMDITIDNASYMFSRSRKLKIIFGNLKAKCCTNMFEDCTMLNEVRLILTENVSIADSPHLNCFSILFAIENEKAISPIVLTLHPDAYSRAMADSKIQAALAAHPNISLASA